MMLSALWRGGTLGTERGDLGCFTLFFVPYNTSLFGAVKACISVLERGYHDIHKKFLLWMGHWP
jgi:hypothetical protein